MADNFRTDLDQLLPQRRQRPLLHGIGQRQGTHEVAEVNLRRKEARDIEPRDFVWAFVVESYLPTVIGHFKFLKVDNPPKIKKLQSFKCKWFNSKDGPDVVVPKDCDASNGRQSVLRIGRSVSA